MTALHALRAAARRAGRSDGDSSVTNTELFFDLVYVFAVTQLSHTLLHELSITGALKTAVLLVTVWLAWIYTVWVTSWLSPDDLIVRLTLLGVMLGSLVLAASLPRAFGDRGLVVGAAFAGMQVVRTVIVVALLTGRRSEQRNFLRILVYCSASGALWIICGQVDGPLRVGRWVAGLAVDLIGGLVGFWTPGLGRSTSAGDWAIDGRRIAERCEAFVLIALGEGIVVIGSSLADLDAPTGAEIGAFVAAFAGGVLLWWVYFGPAAAGAARVMSEAEDPGALARSAYHLLHPVLIGGIIVAAAGDTVTLEAPTAPGGLAIGWLVLGGAALYLAGHAAFCAILGHVEPWVRAGAAVLLLVLVPLTSALPRLALGGIDLAVLLIVCLSDGIRSSGSAVAPARS